MRWLLIFLIGCGGGGLSITGPKAEIELETTDAIISAILYECEDLGFPGGCEDRLRGKPLRINYEPSFPGLAGQFTPPSDIMVWHHRATPRTLGHELIHWMLWYEMPGFYVLDHEPKEVFKRAEEIGAEFIRWDTWAEEFYAKKASE